MTEQEVRPIFLQFLGSNDIPFALILAHESCAQMALTEFAGKTDLSDEALEILKNLTVARCRLHYYKSDAKGMVGIQNDDPHDHEYMTHLLTSIAQGFKYLFENYDRLPDKEFRETWTKDEMKESMDSHRSFADSAHTSMVHRKSYLISGGLLRSARDSIDLISQAIIGISKLGSWVTEFNQILETLGKLQKEFSFNTN